MEETNMNRIYQTFSLYLLAGGSLLLGSCTSEEPIDPAPTAGSPLEINASISPLTRAGEKANDYDKTKFVEGDVIAITPTSTSTSTSHSYTYQSDIWRPLEEKDSIKVQGNTVFTASYPTPFEGIQSDQSKSETVNDTKNKFASYQKSNQFTATATSTGNQINFAFAPAAAKIRLVITYPTGETHTGGSVTITGNKLLNDTDEEQTITLLPITESGQTHVYVGIVYPGENKSYKITVKENRTENSGGSSEITHTHNESSRTLVAGIEYTYNFSSNSNLILNSVTVNGFGNGGNHNLGDAT